MPGGHLEHGGSITACAEREGLEETGLKLRGVKIEAVTNDVFEAEGKHYVTLFVRCEMEDPEAQPEVCGRGAEPQGWCCSDVAQVLEPEKCEGWHWNTWEDLKRLSDQGEKLFLPLTNFLKEL